MTDKKAIDMAKQLVSFCQDQRGCQNCVFRKFGSDHWNCHLDMFGIRDVVGNYEAKRKNHGYI